MMVRKIMLLAAWFVFCAAHSTQPHTSPQEHFATVNHVRLHYLEQGSGPLVILLHGWPETSYEWRSNMQVLAQKYRVVAPDLRGLGLSEKTATGYDKQTIAQDIKRFENLVKKTW